MDIKLSCIVCNRQNCVYGRGARICHICSQRQLRKEQRQRTKRRIETLGGYIVIVSVIYMICTFAHDWVSYDSADYRVHKAMQSRD